MKKAFLGVLGLVLVGTLTACPPPPPPAASATPRYGVADFPMKNGETWGVVFQVGDQKPAVSFQLASNPAIDKDGDVAATLKVAGSAASGGLAFIDNTDGTFNVGVKISSFTLFCYAGVKNNWNNTVKGSGIITDGKNPAEISCAMGKLSNAVAKTQKWTTGKEAVSKKAILQ